MRQLKFITLIACLSLFSLSVRSQEAGNSKDILLQNLIKSGFENLNVTIENNDAYIFYEDRIYRWENDGLNNIIEESAHLFNDSITVHIVPLMRGIPVSIFSFKVIDYKNSVMASSEQTEANYIIHRSFDTDPIRKLLKITKPESRSFHKVDFIFLPGFKLQFGNFNNYVESQVHLATTIQSSFWKGMLLSAQVITPFYSELQQVGERSVRLGNVSIEQLFRFPKNVFLTLSTGFFDYSNPITSTQVYQRYGFHSDLKKYFLDSRIVIGGYAGVTGMIRFSHGIFDYWPLDKVTGAVYGEYYLTKYNLTTRITAGKYLYDDFAVRFNLTRQFKEINIGVFAIKSSMGTNGGFNFSIPISSRKHCYPSAVRASLANDLKYEFIYRTIHRDADMYNTNTDLSDKVRNFNYVPEPK